MRYRTDLPRRVRALEHAWIPLSDGTRLGARIWLPEDAEADPVPAVLEYIPYRKGDGTAVRDAVRHPYLAGHGYAAVRVDMRGSGESGGLLHDEYLPQEQDDALEVLRWLAGQPWCTGSVGMMGISWGGFNSLQVAARRPPELKAVITLCSTDDRYADDVHYRGGCVLATDMLLWATAMTAFNAMPPDPAIAGEGWREMWKERMERVDPYVHEWLRHQVRDDYWRQGSVCEDHAAIEAAVYAVGGWADGYTDAVLRLLAGLPGPRKGLIGPWPHMFPDDDLGPGPAIGWGQEAIRWWDRWLKGIDNGIMDEPMLRAWMQEPVRPAVHHAVRPGRWVAERAWPGAGISPRTLGLGDRTLGATAPDGDPALGVRAVQTCGLEAGVWCADGSAADAPGDQRPDDAVSLCFDSAPLPERLELLGHPVARLALTADRPVALVAVRLCDVAPDGESSLVTRGVLNLTHRDSHAHPEPLEPGRRYDIEVPLDSIAQAVPAGHRLRLAVSPAYWPWLWPSPAPVALTVSPARSSLELPVRPPRPEQDEALHPFGPAEGTPPPATTALHPGADGRTTTRDLVAGTTEVRFDWDLGGRTRHEASGLETEQRASATYAIARDEPLSARVSCECTSGLVRDGRRTRAVARATMDGDAERFRVTTELDAYEDEVRVLARRWTFETPRRLV